jgi:hypothetical protein
MNSESYDYQFAPETDMPQVEEALLLATMAAEGLHGRARIRLEAAFKCDPVTRSAEIDASTEVGDAIARIFTALLTTTIGEPAFRVTRSAKKQCA